MKKHVPAILTAINCVLMVFLLAGNGWLAGEARGSAAQEEAKHLVVKSLTLVDGEGRPRAGMKMENGRPFFYLVGGAGSIVSAWGQSSTGPEIYFNNDESEQALSLGVHYSNQPYLNVSSDPKNGFMRLSWDSQNGASMVIRGREGESSLLLGDNPNGLMLAVTDRHKKLRLMTGVYKDGKSLLAFGDKAQNPILGLGQKDGQPFVMLRKGSENVFLASTDKQGAPYLGLKRKGQVVWREPAGVDLDMETGPLTGGDIDRLLER